MGIAKNRQILDVIMSRSIGGRSEISFQDFRKSPVPAGVKGYMAAAQMQVMNGMTGSTPTGSGDRDGTNGTLVRKALLATLVAEKLYQREEFITELRNAVQFLSGYLVTPQRSLLNAVFEHSAEVPVATVLRKLSFATEYRYLPVLLTEWIRRKGLPAVGQEEIRQVLRAIDHRVVAKHSDQELVNLTRPLFEFATLGEQGRTLSAPADDVRSFYQEKELDEFWERISSGLVSEGASITFASLQNPGSVVPAKGFPPPAAAAVEDRESIPVPARDDGQGPGVSEQPTGRMDEPESSTGTSLPDLENLISPEQETLFVKRLFEHDSAFYAAIISSLNGIATWKEAALYLSQFYQTNDLDPFVDDVVEFTDTVHRRYVHEGVL